MSEVIPEGSEEESGTKEVGFGERSCTLDFLANQLALVTVCR